MGENQTEEKKEEGKVAGEAGEEKESGGGDGKKEEAKNEGGGEGKKEGEGGEEKKGGEKEEEQNPEIVLRVDMHCEGCARKVRRSLRGFPGVEEVHTDSKAHKVVVKGKKADPLKVCERIQKKSGKKAELISPLPKPPEEKKEEKEPPKEEEKKEEPVVVTVVLTVRMHCDSCAQVVQRRIQKMKGVESVETDLKNDKVIVKGVVDPKKLVEYVYKQTRKQATIVPPPPPPPPPPEEKQEEKKEEEKKEEKGESEKKEDEGKECGEEEKKSEVKKSEYWPASRYYSEYAYPPQIFSDENPNACTVM
ncbi:unnamed protein product [Victoria cruziana]